MKKRRKPNLKNPNSMTWRKKADKMWKQCILQVGKCEHCGKTGQLHSHHIISRVRLKYRHDISNGICLCARCHNFDPDISPHVDSYSGQKFIEWLATNRTGQYAWWYDHKDDKRQKEKTYKQCYYELKEIYEKRKSI